MILTKCPDCGNELTQEMIDANMCWECGKILDESLLDEEVVAEIQEQAKLQEAENYGLKENEIPYLNNIKNHMLTTGYCFENYKITKYAGIVSGESVIGTGFLSDIGAQISDIFGAFSKKYSLKIQKAKEFAVQEMVKESVKRGANAIIGISYGYITFSRDMIGVSVTGTSVVIEPDFPGKKV